MEPRIPCVILVRAGSKRLPNKWALPWRGTTLLSHAVSQAWACEQVSRVVVASDSPEILHRAFEADNRTVLVERDEVPDDQTSLDGLRQVQIKAKLEASYVMLVQTTSPFVNPEDLSRLVLCSELPSPGVAALGKRGRPSGMGYIIPPFIEDATPRTFVEQDAPEIDVDEQADYERALELCRTTN